jgi:hypothetical protein
MKYRRSDHLLCKIEDNLVMAAMMVVVEGQEEAQGVRMEMVAVQVL